MPRDGRRVAIATGGTGGHVHPALAVAEAYRRLRPEVEILFLGTVDGPEARLVPLHGHRFVAIPGAPLLRVGAAGKARALVALVRGTATARRVLARAGTELALGFGGYASAGTILGARTLRIATVIHEANAVAGVANRVLGRFADRALLGFADVAHDFTATETLVTGTPVRPEIVAVGRARAARLRAPGPLHVLVTGGSAGSPFLNARLPDLLARAAARGAALEVCHQVGEGAPAEVARAYERAGVPARVHAWLEDMPAAYRAADLAIVCAGAGTLTELAMVGLPALLVPLAAAALDHQTQNARAYAALTGSRWVREDAWDAEPLARWIAELAAAPAALVEAGERARLAAHPDAAEAIVVACEALLAG